MTERAHAILSASGAHRWLECPPSARLEEQFEETTSDYAEEGRLAHEIAELKLRKQFTEPMGPKTFNKKLGALKRKKYYAEEMLSYTDAYYDYVNTLALGYSKHPYVVIEKQVDFSEYVPEGFGTADCIMIAEGELTVIDFKYGKGIPVSATDNPQMKLYALGALLLYGFLFPIKNVRLVIVQPRLDSISEWVAGTPDDLIAWGDAIKPIAEMAFEGKGEFKSGNHCRFCRAKALCRARSEFNVNVSKQFEMKRPPLLTNEEVGVALTLSRDIKKWVADLEEYALGACLAGDEVRGWKAVEGRSIRTFTDTDAAFKLLQEHGYGEAVLYERKPISLTAVEKLTGKKEFDDLLAGLVEKPPGKPTLTPEDDKREAITAKTTAAEDFKN